MKIDDNQKELLIKFAEYVGEHKLYLPFRYHVVRNHHVDNFIESLALGKPEPLAKNKQTQIFKPYKCNHCGRRFIDKLHHKCNTGYRKHKHSWTVIEQGDEKADATARCGITAQRHRVKRSGVHTPRRAFNAPHSIYALLYVVDRV